MLKAQTSRKKKKGKSKARWEIGFFFRTVVIYHYIINQPYLEYWGQIPFRSPPLPLRRIPFLVKGEQGGSGI